MSAASPSSSGIMRSLFAPILCLLESRQVVYYLTRKRIVLRYRGSALGIVWSFIVPALTLAIYTIVFGIVLRARWSNEDSSTTEYALLLYLGLCVYWFVSDCVSEAPGLIANHSSYVKKVVFPSRHPSVGERFRRPLPQRDSAGRFCHRILHPLGPTPLDPCSPARRLAAGLPMDTWFLLDARSGRGLPARSPRNHQPDAGGHALPQPHLLLHRSPTRSRSQSGLTQSRGYPGHADT